LVWRCSNMQGCSHHPGGEVFQQAVKQMPSF
jgi:hypothetical protein